MSFSGFLDNQAGVGRNLSVGPTTGMGEAISSSFDFTWKAHTTAAAIQYQGLPLNERNDTIKQRFGQDIYDITGLREKYTNPSADGRVAMLKEANQKIDDWILKGRTKEPEKYKGIKTSAEIRDEARKTVNISENHMNEVMARNPSSLSRLTGGFIGGVGATLLDPPNLLTLPLGAGEIQAGLKGWGAARAILKAAAIDGSINAAIEATTQPAIMQWQKELGRRYGFGDAAENVALAFVGGAGLSAALRGLSRGINYAGSASADVLDKIASSEKLPASVRDAASFMSRQAHIDEALPEGMIKTGEDLKVHRDTAQKVAEEFEAYKPPSKVEGNQPEVAETQARMAEKTEKEITPEPKITVNPAKNSDGSQTIDMEILDKNGQNIGLITGKEFDKYLKVNISGINQAENRGAGNGISAYKNLADYAISKGKELRSDTEVTPDAARMYEALKKRGYKVTKAKGAKLGNETGRPAWTATDKNGKAVPVYKVSGGPEVKPVDKMDDIAPTERIQPVKLPEGLTPEVSADRVAIAESDMKGLVDELGDETITLDDGRAVSIKDFAEEIQAKKKVIEAMKTCRIA